MKILRPAPLLRRLARLLGVGTCLALLIAACGDDSLPPTPTPAPPTATPAPVVVGPCSSSAPTPGVDTFSAPAKLTSYPDGLQACDWVSGSGAVVLAGQKITVQYTGWLTSNGTQFDSSRSAGRPPTQFTLGGVIKGWNEGVPGMKIGGKRRLVIPAALAYDKTPPSGSNIPAGANLTFDIEIVSVP